ncbi:MAG: hypothetical protein ACTSPY_13130 [Candidatus Helarchaeota archaeon]
MNKTKTQNETMKIVKNNGIFLLSSFEFNDKDTVKSYKNSFYYTIFNNIKFCSFVIDFETNKYKDKSSFNPISKDVNNNTLTIADEIIKRINLDDHNLNHYKLLAFSRYRFKYFYIDHLLIQSNSKVYLITSIHLAQFVEFDEFPNYKPIIKFHNKWIRNLKIRNDFELKDIRFSILYGKSNTFSFICILIGFIIIFLSIFGLINFWSIIFGIFAIIIGIFWFFPI